MNFKKSLYALGIAGACSVSVSAQTTVIDYPAPNPFYNSSYSTNMLFSFTTGTGSSVAPITGIEVFGFAPAAGTVSVDLYQGTLSGGSIIGSTLLGSSTLSFSSGNWTDITLIGLSSAAGTIGAVSLNPNTTYMLVFDNHTANLEIASGSPLVLPSDYITSGGWSVPNQAAYNANYTSNTGWVQVDYAAVSITTGSASPVPEASGSVAGLGLAVAGLYQLRRRRQNTVTQ